MLMLLAPSKTMDFVTKLPYDIPRQQPLFIEEATQIARAVQALSADQMAEIMRISPALTEKVQVMYEDWHPRGQKPALYTYVGDVFKGMKANQLSKESAEWAQRHLLIMSGLYGMVRPFDYIRPYRLEMKAPLKVGAAKNLYDFWDGTLAEYVEAHADGLVFNLCSDEYAAVVTRQLSDTIRVVFPIFYDERPGGVGRAPIYNKMMRGVMARWMIDHKVTRPEGLKAFKMHGYTYDSMRSVPDQPAFYRSKMVPLVF